MGDAIARGVERPALLGAILAGGASRRMGTPKAGVRIFGSETLAERMVRILSPLCAEVILLGHGEGAPAHLERLPDAAGLAGPVAGVMALLESERADAYLVVPVDMPFLAPAHLQALLPAPVGSGEGAPCAAVFGGHEPDRSLDRPLDRRRLFPVWLHARARGPAEAFLATSGDPAPPWRALLAALVPRCIEPPRGASGAFRNINTPDDLVRRD